MNIFNIKISDYGLIRYPNQLVFGRCYTLVDIDESKFYGGFEFKVGDKVLITSNSCEDNIIRNLRSAIWLPIKDMEDYKVILRG